MSHEDLGMEAPATSGETIWVRGTSRAVHPRRQLLPPIVHPVTLKFDNGPLEVTITAKPDRLARTELAPQECFGRIGETAVKVIVIVGDEAEPTA